MSQWYVYLLRCADGTYYTGVTTDLIRRVREHNGEMGGTKGAKYTKARRPVALIYQEEHRDRSAAQTREYTIRHLPRIEKEKFGGMNR